MRYSFNLDKSDVVFASLSDINASPKDLCVVCDAIRYKRTDTALKILEDVESGTTAMRFRQHNRYMGSRHELGGNPGRFPKKCAGIVRKVLVNACANAKNKGFDADSMQVIHASANKTIVAPRSPPKGTRAVVVGGYGYSSMRRSNLEFAKVEIGLSSKCEGKLGKNSRKLIKMFGKFDVDAPQKKIEKKKTKEKQEVKAAAPAITANKV